MKTELAAENASGKNQKQDLYQDTCYVKLNNYSEEYLNFCANFAEPLETDSTSKQAQTVKQYFKKIDIKKS